MPVSRAPKSRHDADFFAWTREQVEALRQVAETRPNLPVDWANVIEEIEDLGVCERNAMRSQIRRIIEHLLKLEHSPAQPPRAGWHTSIAEARAQLGDHITPTLRAQARTGLDRLYRDARRVAAASLLEHGETDAASALPDACPYRLEQIEDPEWLPPVSAPPAKE